MEEDNWKHTLIGLFIFIAICLLAGWLSERFHEPKDLWECNGANSHLDDNLPKCPSWMFK
ncbi:MAG: hypothetical protein KBD55_00745 [Candidatus Pacebacteria bacterium]|nr:hypothetical protein [Candidatus Paceibacterota bacterium]